MKKRFFSIFLALALCVTLLPAAALADDDGGDQTTANQLYKWAGASVDCPGFGDTPPYDYFKPDAFDGWALPLVIKAEEDNEFGEEYITVSPDEGWTVSYQSGTMNKTIKRRSSDGDDWSWESTGQIPGSKGKLIATKDGESYSMDVTIGAAEIGVYTSADADVDAPGDALVFPDGASYTLDSTNTVVAEFTVHTKTAYVRSGYSVTIIENSDDMPITSSNDKVTCSFDDGVLTVTNTSNTSQSAKISFFVNERPFAYTIHFVSATQLYRVYTDDRTSSGTVGETETTFAVDATGTPAPLFAIKNSDGDTTVITGTDGWSVQYKSTDGTVTKTLAWESESNYEGWRWQSPGQVPGGTGTITATKGDESYYLDVTIGAAEVGVYTDKDADVTKPGNAYVIPNGRDYTVDQSVTAVYLKPGYSYISLVDETDHPVRSDNSNVTASLGTDGILTVTNNSGTRQTAKIKFYVQFESDSEPSPWEYTIHFGAQQQGGGQDTDLSRESDSRDMTDDDYMGASDIPGAVAGFTYDGKTYYMGPCLSDRHLPGGDGAMNFPMKSGEHQYKTFDIAFWTKQGEDYFLVTPELAAELARQFDSLTLDVYALKGDNVPAPKQYPALYSGKDTGYCCPTTLALGLENRATWVFIVTGTIGGRELTASCREKWEPVEKTTYTPTGNDKIAEINTYLAGLKDLSSSTRVEITLPAGTYSGYIHVPNTPNLDIVVVTGAEGKTVSGAIQPRKCVTDERVLYYPQAANADFKNDSAFGGYAYIYSTSWYQVDKIVIWNNFAASWPIPAEYLSGRFTIMNSNGTAALGQWNFGGSQGGQNNRPGGRI